MTAALPLVTTEATGLPEVAITAIRKVLASHPEVEVAILYGSRALGRHRPASDIDLTLIGSAISTASLARIDADLDDLLQLISLITARQNGLNRGAGDAEVVGVELGEHGPGGVDQAPVAGHGDHRRCLRHLDAERRRNIDAGPFVIGYAQWFQQLHRAMDRFAPAFNLINALLNFVHTFAKEIFRSATGHPISNTYRKH